MSTTIRETETPRVIPVEVERAVKRGAELLDDRHPGWADKIDTQRLEVADSCNCVLGQVYGTFRQGLHLVELIDGLTDWFPEAASHGFCGDDFDRYSDLDAAWLAEIMERRSA